MSGGHGLVEDYVEGLLVGLGLAKSRESHE